ncbi:MAG TPA: hypothetical protein VG125_00320, partial [Pirellulales bacterium]|nr:hypothetical protein [Pirellulales bacterium]
LVVALDGGPGAVLGDLRTADVRRISLVGNGASDVLTVDGLSTSGGLVIDCGGAVEINGAVSANDSLAIHGNQRLDIAAGGSLSGGTITVGADDVINVGRIDARGDVAIATRDYLNAGTVSAPGGNVRIDFTDSYIDTASALTTAAANGGSGGHLVIDGGASGRLFSSGRFDATGDKGGSIELLGKDVLLIAATVDASGRCGGGTIQLGGGWHGSELAAPNAQTVDVSAATKLRADGGSGPGGVIVVWSQARTDFAGQASATGPGAIEVSSAGALHFTGQTDAGQQGTVKLDPDTIVVSDPPAGVFPQFGLVNPGSGGSFGDFVFPLSTDNIVVTDTKVNMAGAVYLFNGQTGALISALAETGGLLGSFQTTLLDVEVLPSGNFVVANPTWNSDTGAVTWVNGTTGLSGAVSASNSLVGSRSGNINTGDQVGGGHDLVTGVGSLQSVIVLSDGNYTVGSPLWNGKRGAVTWGSGTAGVHGAVSSANSLVGSNAGDEVGGVPGVAFSGVVTLTNGNYVVPSPLWNGSMGAATWGDGTKGVTGEISSSNSLVGSSSNDEVGLGNNGIGNVPGVTPLTNGNYVVSSPNYFSGTGAATWGNGTTGVTGQIDSTNSLIGNVNTMSDHVGETVVALTNGNYVVSSPSWSTNQGAATWGNGATGVSGVVSSSNSLIGHRQNFFTGDGIGQHITALSNGNYVVLNPDWSIPSGSTVVGAATWGNGATGITGQVSTGNSLVGSNSNDFSDAAVLTLTNGNYVVDSPMWNGGMGAVTWGNGTSGTIATISIINSLIGSQAGDHVGFDFATNGTTFAGTVTALSNGNYVVDSPNWKGNTGAVTWCDGTAGRTGSVSSTNSLVGSQTGDQVGADFDFSTGTGSGGVTVLKNGNYVVASVYWNNKTGAVTWGSGTAGVTGTISSNNSLIGATTGDAVGGLATTFVPGVTALPNGNYVVVSPNFSGGEGAITWVNGAAATGAIVSSNNSVVGSAAGDMLGNSSVNFIILSNGNYVVSSPAFKGGLGAFTWGSGRSGATLDGQHTVDAQNSIEGAVAGADQLSIPAAGTLPGSFAAVFPKENGGVVTIGFTDPNQITSTLATGQTITVVPSFLTGSLNAGTNVTLQA